MAEARRLQVDNRRILDGIGDLQDMARPAASRTQVEVRVPLAMKLPDLAREAKFPLRDVCRLRYRELRQGEVEELDAFRECLLIRHARSVPTAALSSMF